MNKNFIKPLLLSAFVLTSLFLVGPNFFSREYSTTYSSEELEANLKRIIYPEKFPKKVLENYPFSFYEEFPVSIAEGFEVYDGNLKDVPNTPHWGIDYVRRNENTFLQFPVFSAHSGNAFQGFGKQFGSFVIIKNDEYETLYAHLENIPQNIPFLLADTRKNKGVIIDARAYIGTAGVTRNTKSIPQLHFELHKNVKREIVRVDPYGVYGRLSSGLYPQPGELVNTFSYWLSDSPSFVSVSQP